MDLARRLLELPDPILCDEFTSVVDRQVAQIGSHAVQKHVRKLGRKFVAVSCHYDIIDWLQPDWIFEPATMAFTRRSLQQRPTLECVVSRVPYAAWQSVRTVSLSDCRPASLGSVLRSVRRRPAGGVRRHDPPATSQGAGHHGLLEAGDAARLAGAGAGDGTDRRLGVGVQGGRKTAAHLPGPPGADSILRQVAALEARTEAHVDRSAVWQSSQNSTRGSERPGVREHGRPSVRLSSNTQARRWTPQKLSGCWRPDHRGERMEEKVAKLEDLVAKLSRRVGQLERDAGMGRMARLVEEDLEPVADATCRTAWTQAGPLE